MDTVWFRITDSSQWNAIVKDTAHGMAILGWEPMEKKYYGQQHKDRWGLRHSETGMYVTGTGAGPSKVECSLPRIVYWTNGRLIRNQEELELAINEMLSILSEVACNERGDCLLSSISRMDFPWHIVADFDQLAVSFRHARVPCVRVPRTEEFATESLKIGGKSSRSCLLLYRKALEMKKEGRPLREGEEARGVQIIRVETQFMKLPAEHVLNLHRRWAKTSGGRMWYPKFDIAYEMFRNFLARILGPAVHNTGKGIAGFLAASELESEELRRRLPRENIGSPLKRYLTFVGPRRARDLRREVVSRIAQARGCRLIDLFPENAPPPAFEFGDHITRRVEGIPDARTRIDICWEPEDCNLSVFWPRYPGNAAPESLEGEAMPPGFAYDWIPLPEASED